MYHVAVSQEAAYIAYWIMGRVGSLVRLKSLKGKRWQKGQSSSSNPQTHKHRNAARGKFSGHLAQSQTQEQGAVLTKDALASHDAIQGDQDDLQLNRCGIFIKLSPLCVKC